MRILLFIISLSIVTQAKCQEATPKPYLPPEFDSSYLSSTYRDRDHVIMIGMAPIFSAGISGTHSTSPSEYKSSSLFSYEAGVVFVYADRPLIDRFFCVPILGGGFSSNGVLYKGNGLMDNTIRSSYANAYAGLAFPFLQFGVSLKFPLSASSSLQLEENVQRVVSLPTSLMNTIWEPTAILFYPLPIKGVGTVVPYVRFDYALTETFNSPFSLSDQNFISSDQRLDSYKSFSLKIGFTYAFTIFRHYEPRGFDEEEGVY